MYDSEKRHAKHLREYNPKQRHLNYLKNRDQELTNSHRNYLKNHDKKLASSKKHHADNKEYRHKWFRNYHLRLKIEVLSYYSKGDPFCICCGETILEFLTIDHINNNGNKHRKTFTMTMYGWLKKHNFPKGYQVMCFNCNHGKYINKGICPHKVIKEGFSIEK